jgi:hypothetical protein
MPARSLNKLWKKNSARIHSRSSCRVGRIEADRRSITQAALSSASGPALMLLFDNSTALMRIASRAIRQRQLHFVTRAARTLLT